MTALQTLPVQSEFDRSDIVQLLSLRDPADIELLRAAAEARLLEECGPQVYFRGLIEFSNICQADCFYCGIRKGNSGPKRFTLTKDEVVDAALSAAGAGYGSIVLQSGERRDSAFVDFVVDLITAIKAETRSAQLSDGLGITLSLGEQTRESYERFFQAGAHRYLLRIETSSPALFARIHPAPQLFSERVKCLEMLKQIGYLVGTGVMIGLPGQTIEELADDILFFKSRDIDMIGMGPYIPHAATPLPPFGNERSLDNSEKLLLALKMIAVTRLVLSDVNIAATTALQALAPDGREQGLSFGANVIMPQLTPLRVKRDYVLYDGKPCLDEGGDECASCCARRVTSLGRSVAKDTWGDPLHGTRRLQQHLAIAP